jgi:hypothetical protein
MKKSNEAVIREAVKLGILIELRKREVSWELLNLLLEKSRQLYRNRREHGDVDPNGLMYGAGKYMPDGDAKDHVLAMSDDLELVNRYIYGDGGPPLGFYTDFEDRKWIEYLHEHFWEGP